MRKRKGSGGAPPLEFVAGNGLLHRRALLQGGVMFAGALGGAASLTSAAAEPLTEPEWSLYPGTVTPVLQTPSKFEKDVVRTLSNPKGDARTQHARAPLQKLNGTVTPNALHFTINHSGIPDIDPDKHVLVDPRHGQTAAGIHHRRADALPDGDAQAFRRMWRQQRADVLAGADPGAAAGAAWPGVLRGMDRGAGVDACSTRPASIRRRPGCWPRARIRLR